MKETQLAKICKYIGDKHEIELNDLYINTGISKNSCRWILSNNKEIFERISKNKYKVLKNG